MYHKLYYKYNVLKYRVMESFSIHFKYTYIKNFHYRNYLVDEILFFWTIKIYSSHFSIILILILSM